MAPIVGPPTLMLKNALKWPADLSTRLRRIAATNGLKSAPLVRLLTAKRPKRFIQRSGWNCDYQIYGAETRI